MPKNIVVLSDGTGQNGGKGRDTNIYKLFRMLEDRTMNQVVFYDEGIGTETQRIIGSAFGVGFDKNVLQCYRFIFDNYQSGDKIYLFGFSRGAATVRSLASFIHYFGILPASRPELIKQAYRIYSNRQSSSDKLKETLVGFNPLKILNRLIHRWNRAWRYDLDDEVNGESAKFVRLHPNQWVQIEFLGVWDTVPALGLVVSDLLDAVLDFLPALRHNHHNFQLRKSVKHACHAISIDDRRKWFWPTVWRETQENHERKLKIQELMVLKRQLEKKKDSAENLNPAMDRLKEQIKQANKQRVEQVWFGGSHTDVGGGFWEAGFSDLALEWMIQKAFAHGLKLYFGSRKYWNFCISPDATDDFHDPRAGLGKIYAVGERNDIWNDAMKTFGPPRVHLSVLERARDYLRKPKRIGDGEEKYNPWIINMDFEEGIQYLQNSATPTFTSLEDALELDSEGLRNWLNGDYDKWCLSEHHRSEYAGWLREVYLSDSVKKYRAWCLKTKGLKKKQDIPSLKEWMELPDNSFEAWQLKNMNKLTYKVWTRGNIEPLNRWINGVNGREILVERERDIVYDPAGNALILCEEDKEKVEKMIPEGRKVLVLRDYYRDYPSETSEIYKLLRDRARRLNPEILAKASRSERKRILRHPHPEDYVFRVDRDRQRWQEIKERLGKDQNR